jgi:hypothetical protein
MTPAAAERSFKSANKSPNKAPNESQSAPTRDMNWPAPLKPRPGLMVALLCVFAVWMGVLLWMYFTTTRPSQPAPVTAPALARAQG